MGRGGGGNCPEGNWLGAVVWGGIVQGVIVLRGAIVGGGGAICLWGVIVQRVIVSGGYCPWGNCPGGICRGELSGGGVVRGGAVVGGGGKGGNCPDTEYTVPMIQLGFCRGDVLIFVRTKTSLNKMARISLLGT